MKAYGNLHSEVDDVLDVYFHGCALAMSCVDVARAFAFSPTAASIPRMARPW